MAAVGSFGTGGVSYTVRVDGTAVATGVTTTSYTIPKSAFSAKKAYSITVIAHYTGMTSAASNAVSFTFRPSNTVAVRVGVNWVPCVAFYYNGTAWVECTPYCRQGGMWKECNTA